MMSGWNRHGARRSRLCGGGEGFSVAMVLSFRRSVCVDVFELYDEPFPDGLTRSLVGDEVRVDNAIAGATRKEMARVVSLVRCSEVQASRCLDLEDCVRRMAVRVELVDRVAGAGEAVEGYDRAG